MKENIISFLIGILFAIGLIVSGMYLPEKSINFFSIPTPWNNIPGWDPSLIFVMIGAIIVTFTFYQILPKKFKKVKSATEKCSLANKKIDKRLIIGACLFGFGWSLAGICPGPAFVLIGLQFKQTIFFLLFTAIGMFIGKKFFPYK